jgi:hypothetical protein
MRSNTFHLEHEAMTTAATLNSQPIRTLSSSLQQDHVTLAMHQEAENALAMALHYLRGNGSNVSCATRKAVQALGALNRLETLSLGSGAQMTGRA